MQPKTKTIFLNILIFGFLLFASLSIFTYHPQDPGFGVEGAKEIKNIGGLLGAYLSSFFIFFFGIVALFIPIFTFLSYLLLFFLFSLRKIILINIFLLISLCLSFSFLFEMLEIKDKYLWMRFPLHGGFIGEISSLFIKALGVPGFFLLIILLLLIPGFILLDRTKFLARFFKSDQSEEKFSIPQEKTQESPAPLELRDIKVQTGEKNPLSEHQVQSEETPEVSIPKKLTLPPPIDLLSDSPTSSYKIKPEELKERALLLKAKLREFGIEGEVTGINPGPVITVFEFKPAPGIKLSKILSLVDDLALGLSAKSVRIVAPIPGKSVIGIEISNPQRELVYLKEILTEETFKKSNSPLTFSLGKDLSGIPVVADLRKMPHLLIAGSTGSGKSIFIHSIILSILYKSTPEEVKFLMIDPKRIELSVYDGIPYLLHPVVLEPNMATRALRWAVSEMERRYSLFEEFSVRNLESYNEEFEEKLPYIVIIIDELADLMVVSSKEVETLLTRLAQMARAAGIHLIVATQRPSVDVITGLIKVNFPARISFQVTSKVDSRTILDTQGAERLLGAGDMLFMPPGSSHLQRIHAPFVSEKEVKRVVDYLKSFGEPEYLADLESLADESEEETLSSDPMGDELYQEALKIAYQYGKISVSMLQRKLRIGYNRAARIVEKMEEEGILGPSDGVRPRPVIGPRKPL
ncbi:primosome, DnaD subunit [Caldimicrobium thiodismutans]|uniref:Primosome, DnaD subunit n=1 Tax=Caldimicrobium thiodismutans TaxID=1653476 RepID=A0A0U5B003_9BACT|nr:DNA translocase FtsK 4TM domain-containing protein [Caldimicrobium thiodismutans]BAU24111.1 primosome, DnaD subunit [Caldimicrobium thiodismutans]